jgi:DHA2 family multidrug resistance protein
VGLGLIAAGCFIQAHNTAEAGFWQFVAPQILRGAGFVTCFTTIMMPAMQALPPHLVHAGTSLVNTMRNLGGAFGIAGLATIQAHAFALHRQELYSAADPSNPHVAGMIAGAQAHLEQTGAIDPERQALMHYAGLLDREALVMAFNDLFMLLAVVTALSTVGLVFLRRSRNVPVGGAEQQVAPSVH